MPAHGQTAGNQWRTTIWPSAHGTREADTAEVPRTAVSPDEQTPVSTQSIR